MPACPTGNRSTAWRAWSQGAAFVVGVDTGLLHLAAALGVPLVAIFVGSEPGLTGPMGRGPIAVVGGKDARPSVSDVVGALEQLVSDQ